MKTLVLLLFCIIPWAIFAREQSITDLTAPPLGVTSSSVLLLWEDSYIPDYSDSEWKNRTYHIFKDGKKIGATNKRSFPVYGLHSSTAYKFSVQLPKQDDRQIQKELTLQVMTKKAGAVFDVRKYGAKGDGKTLDTKAVHKAIDACSKDGTVLIPAGKYILDHIELKSDMTLQIEQDALLHFLGYNEGGNYPPTKAELDGPDGVIHIEKRYLITGYKVRNVIITGKGIVHGNGETWWPHYKKLSVNNGRPFMLGFIQSSNILVQGVAFHDPPAWNNHLLYTDSVLYNDVKFKQVSTVPGHNADGIDADASRHILVAGCLFGTQDDSFAIKSGRYNNEGNKRRRSSEYITVRDCIFDGTISPGATTLGLAIGSEVSGGARHIHIKNCTFVDVASVINIKTNRSRPYAIVEDVRVENCNYSNNFFSEKDYNRAPLAIDMFYYGQYANPDTFIALNPTTPLFHDIHFKNIHIENHKGKFAYLRGMPEQPMRNITFENISGTAIEGFYGENIDSLNLINVSFKADSGALYTWNNAKNISQTCGDDTLAARSAYRPYTSSQDTSLTLYANFFIPKKPSPILVWMHGWHGRAKQRSADDVAPPHSKKWFLIQPDMRGRADSEGKQDCNGWELQDIIDAVEFAREKYPALIVNSERVSLIGGSGGGGNVLGLVGKFPDYFSAAVAEFVISDYGMWFDHDSVKGEFRDEMETKGWIGGSPQTNAEAYASRGGLTTVENLNTPLAIIHGDRDKRVQIAQSRVYVKKAAQAGKKELINYLELPGVGAFKGGAHWENVTKEQMKARIQLTKDHLKQHIKPPNIPAQGKFVVAGYLKTKYFEVILDSIDHIGEVVYNLDKDEFSITSKSAKTAILKIKRGDNWDTKIIKTDNR